MAKSYINSFLSLFLLLQCLFIGLNLHTTVSAQQITTSSSTYVYALCPDITTVSSNSTYQTNINTLLSVLSSNSSNKNHFYNTTVGTGPDLIYGLFFCRVDVTTAACQKCVSLATKALITRCPGKKVSIVWYFDQCVVRYSDKPFMGNMTDHPMIPMWNRQNSLDIWNVTSNMTGFMEVLLDTMGEASALASSGRVANRFSTKEARFGANLTSMDIIYTLVECTPDITLAECKSCLTSVIGNTTELCNVKAGCTLMCPNCNMRYDIYPFYGNASLTSFGPSDPSFGGTDTEAARKKRALLIGVITGLVLALAGMVLLGIVIFAHKRKSKKPVNDFKDMENVESLKYDFNTIRLATNNFSEDKKLGEGGFGEVFKGKLECGQEVAVKRLSRNSIQGIEEFKTEILLVAKLQHRNLVKLLGFCILKTEMLLVYEFMQNSSLDRVLFDPTKCASLDWRTRYKIMQGIAKGLLYLHEDSRLKIIHRDLKSSNVLLDKDMNAKISDFGTARLFGADQTQGMTNKIAGTFGYMAPEYVITGQFSVKSDVYSFGVIVLEIVTGQRNKMFCRREGEESLLQRAWRLWNEEKIMELVDSKLSNNYSPEEVATCIHIGLLCIQEDAARRPNMASVVASLNGDAIVFPLPTPPHLFITDSSEEISSGGLDQNVPTFTGTMSITVMDPR